MAVRKTSARKTRGSAKRSTGKNNRASFSMIFWVFFIIVFIIAFFTFLPKVKKGVNLSLPLGEMVTEQPESQEPLVLEKSAQPEKPPVPKPPERTTTEKPAEKPPASAVAKDTPPEKPTTPSPPPPAERQAPQRQPQQQQPAQQTTPRPPPASPPEQKPPETRERTIYFMQEGGADLQLVKVNRKLAVSDSPLLDSINALLAGPSVAEQNRGLISCIPSNARLISAQVSNNTVFLNFNEEFRYNTFGREGSAAQLRQIVWTATEFPNVNNVQIMIEGNIVDFLVEGVTIRSPIER